MMWNPVRFQATAKVGAWLLICANILLTGCIGTVIWDVAPKQPKPVASQPIDLRVELVLSKEIREAKWEDKISPFQTAVIPLGDAFVIHSENMARALFREVIIGPASASLTTSAVDALLVPRIVSVQRTQPTTIFGQQTSTVILEWTFTDPKGTVIWINTLTGQGQSAMGLTPMYGAEKQMAILFEQLFGESYKSISSSVEIRRFEEKR